MVQRVVCVFGFGCLIATGCATLDQLRPIIQPPRFEQADNRQSTIRLTPPTTASPSGGATVTLWTKVSNPNSFGLTVGTLRGSLHLESARAATVDFPLGLPLSARGEAEVPIDISVSFQDVPGLSQAITRAIAREPIAYTLDGTIGVSAGRLGEPVFGPMTILRGQLR
jgi:hypothetical protein